MAGTSPAMTTQVVASSRVKAERMAFLITLYCVAASCSAKYATVLV
jgi:hypothetical protein